MAPTLIILAAGQGTRLKPITDVIPKCMVEVKGRPMIHWQVEVARQLGIKDIVIVTGYQKEEIDIKGVTYLENQKYMTTNMVRSLFCAREKFTEQIIVSYGDIIFESRILAELMESVYDISVSIDLDWQRYWEQRFEDPFIDAETLIMDNKGFINEIGQKTKNIKDIQGQYIGLTAYKNKGVDDLCALYDKEEEYFLENKKCICSQRNLDELYMTDMIQGLINDNIDVKGVSHRRGWLEVDDWEDLVLAEKCIVNKEDTFIIN